MIEPIAPITQAAVPPVQPVQNTAPAASAAGASSAGNADFPAVFEQAAILQNINQADANQATALDTSVGSDNSLLDSALLTNLSPQALSALSEVNTDTVGTTAPGALTPAQQEEIITLQNDAQMLNVTETQTFSSDVSLLENGSTVTLSTQAVNIINGLNSGTSISAGTLTTAQLQQIAGILTPFINEPLTPDTLAQVQATLVAAGFSPAQLSLQNIFLSMNYLTELSPVTPPDAEQLAFNETVTDELLNA